MKEYELTVLVHPDLEVDLDAPTNIVRKLINDNGGEIVSEDNWGKKKLAYTIKGENYGIYLMFDVKLPAAAPLKISNTLNITDEVLRYLLVKVDEKGRALLEEAKKRSAEREATADDEE